MSKKTVSILLQNVWVAIIATMFFCSIATGLGYAYGWGFVGVGVVLLLLNLFHRWKR